METGFRASSRRNPHEAAGAAVRHLVGAELAPFAGAADPNRFNNFGATQIPILQAFQDAAGPIASTFAPFQSIASIVSSISSDPWLDSMRELVQFPAASWLTDFQRQMQNSVLSEFRAPSPIVGTLADFQEVCTPGAALANVVHFLAVDEPLAALGRSLPSFQVQLAKPPIATAAVSVAPLGGWPRRATTELQTHRTIRRATPPTASLFFELSAVRAAPSVEAVDRLARHVPWNPDPDVRAATIRRATVKDLPAPELVRRAIHRGIFATLACEPQFSRLPGTARQTGHGHALIDSLSPDEYSAWFFRETIHQAECWLLYGVCAVAYAYDVAQPQAQQPANSTGSSARPKQRKARSDRLEYDAAARGYWRACHRTTKSNPSCAEIGRDTVPDVVNETVRRAILRFRAEGKAWPPPAQYDEQRDRPLRIAR